VRSQCLQAIFVRVNFQSYLFLSMVANQLIVRHSGREVAFSSFRARPLKFANYAISLLCGFSANNHRFQFPEGVVTKDLLKTELSLGSRAGHPVMLK
jgi:hypothetical protein